MAMTETYNGWTNYETWLVNLWLTNEEEIWKRSRDTARAAMSDFAGGEAIGVMLPHWLELPDSGLAADLLNASLQRVDWTAIGASMREE